MNDESLLLNNLFQIILKQHGDLVVGDLLQLLKASEKLGKSSNTCKNGDFGRFWRVSPARWLGFVALFIVTALAITAVLVEIALPQSATSIPRPSQSTAR